MNVLERRRRLLATGYPVIPLYGKVPPNTKNNTNKRRSLTGWEQLGDVTDELLVMWSKTWPDAQNTGILTRTMPTLDLDILDNEAVRALEDYVREHYEESGAILVRIGKPPKRAIPFRTIEPFDKFVVNLVAPNGSDEKIEFLGNGAQVAAFGIHPDTQQPYRWHGGKPGETRLEELPCISGEAAHQLVDELAQILVDRFGYTRAKGRPGKRKSKGNGQDVAGDQTDRTSAPADWQYLIDNILAGRQLHDSLRDLAAKMVASGMAGGAAVNSLRAMMNASQAPRDDRLKDRYAEIPRLVSSAQDLLGAPAPRGQHQPPPNSEEALALQFASEHGHELRYVALWSRWLAYDGTCWQFDDTLGVFDRVRALCREIAAQCNNLKLSRTIASAKTVAAAERLARADRQIAATVEQWDGDLWQINTPAGVVEIRSGELRPHQAADYMTKITACGPGGDCPLWRSFLDRITGGDIKLQCFLQRWCGYALTGSTREHALGFGYGVGANGKSVFTSTITGVLADYATTAPIETFTVTNTEQHPTELARLRGARLVVSTETEEGRRWAESKIKMLTGGDRTAARFMRQDFFEFTPQFKLWIVGNHKPGLRSVNEAIRRRFLLVPFNVVIPPAERDEDLADKLKAEWPGILQWMIDGALEWQRTGLAPPSAVTDATAAYLESEDAISLWLEECTVADPNAWESHSALFGSWKAWAERAGEYVGTQRRFLQSLETKSGAGVEYERRMHARGYRGRCVTATQWTAA